MNGKEKYGLITKFKEGKLNKSALIVKLGLSRRQVDRLILSFDPINENCYEHGNKGIIPASKLPEKTKKLIVDLYRTKYSDCNFNFYSELLIEREGIKVSPTAVKEILRVENIISPRATRQTKKDMKKN